MTKREEIHVATKIIHEMKMVLWMRNSSNTFLSLYNFYVDNNIEFDSFILKFARLRGNTGS